MYADATPSHTACQLSTGQDEVKHAKAWEVLRDFSVARLLRVSKHSLIPLSIHSTVFIGIHAALDLCSRLSMEVGKSL